MILLIFACMSKRLSNKQKTFSKTYLLLTLQIILLASPLQKHNYSITASGVFKH